MKRTEKRSDYLTRNGILDLLSDAEVTRVSTAETAPTLVAGAEFVDLERLEKGVQRSIGRLAPMARVLPRESVSEATWKKILTMLPAPPKTGKRAS